jgi:hypothetical protein
MDRSNRSRSVSSPEPPPNGADPLDDRGDDADQEDAER